MVLIKTGSEQRGLVLDMSKTKTCDHCQMPVPEDAQICGHCHAEFVNFQDKSIIGRIKGAFVIGGILGVLSCIFLGPIFGIIFMIIGSVIGAWRGFSREITIR